MEGSEALAGAAGGFGVFALGVDADEGAIGGQRLGMMVPTPLPVLVGAMDRRWAGPS
jgi:hypothetical protein